MKTETELRELDAWIAQFAMGWMKSKMGHLECAGRFAFNGSEVYIHDRGNYVKLFHPTTDPAAAMLVLEKCAATNAAGKTITIIIFSELEHGRFGVGCEAAYEKDEIDPQFAATLPLAICLFAKELFK